MCVFHRLKDISASQGFDTALRVYFRGEVMDSKSLSLFRYKSGR